LDRLDQNRAAREEALNNLESYIYHSRDIVEDAVFQQVSSDEELKAFRKKVEATTEWLYASESATLEDFRSKLAELK
jgi:hypoxia up-regulated 1